MARDTVRAVPVEVIPYSPHWTVQFDRVAETLRAGLSEVTSATVEHVGSTSVPGLAAKPILDIDVVVDAEDMAAAIAAIEGTGYAHRGDLGVTDREAFEAPDDGLRRNVYVCRRGSLNVRNHLAVRDVLRGRADLRDEYGAVKMALAAEPDMDIETYVARKSTVLQKVLAVSELTAGERLQILRLNDPSA
ncbi:MAG: GrpB family protein [Ornithinimicrobium sp.]